MTEAKASYEQVAKITAMFGRLYEEFDRRCEVPGVVKRHAASCLEFATAPSNANPDFVEEALVMLEKWLGEDHTMVKYCSWFAGG